MTDVVDPATRSRMMSGIRGKDTQPELLIRKALHGRGYRYKLHDKRLPGKPDLVFPKCHAVIFIHGCFWHKHDCHLFKWPSTRKQFWKQKISGNRERDEKNIAALIDDGWRVLEIWECATKGPGRLNIDKIVDRSVKWLEGRRKRAEISGRVAKKFQEHK